MLQFLQSQYMWPLKVAFVKSKWSVYDNELLHFSPLIGPTQKMNLFQSITSALDNTLASDPTAGRMLKQERQSWKQ